MLTQMKPVHVLTVAKGDSADEMAEAKATQAAAVQYLERRALSVETATRSGSAAESILEYVGEVDASILAIGAFGTGPVHEFFFGSTTRAMLEEASCVVLFQA